ncbi:hypothetical protein EX259_11160 [Staphylococcus epidermidis]|uniref:hypothetical protein n=1 Tax=Staphylococcus epidermidis TaxID=1282 RepID=UPI00136A7ED4|nr:hypothetical protein [Staphylococcus epidermidis]MCG1499671.1 hypothetical protein [Staphylococcus epidermidis]NAM70073.1 hypothetical protein [Staphylococcus epidermidis]NAM83058.1 hypothetical protein [Staphylococcus epidermidis]NAM85700.1 hypothetical protein [Staphylococcus epidermidis]
MFYKTKWMKLKTLVFNLILMLQNDKDRSTHVKIGEIVALESILSKMDEYDGGNDFQNLKYEEHKKRINKKKTKRDGG